MKKPQIPETEQARINTLRSLNILDTHPEERFDRLTRMAKRMFDVPIALVSLVDENRQWFKSCLGLNASETSRDISFCGHAILEDKANYSGTANDLGLNGSQINYDLAQEKRVQSNQVDAKLDYWNILNKKSD